MPHDPITITPDPDNGPQLYYTDGHMMIRLDNDGRVLVGVDRRTREIIKAVVGCAWNAINVATVAGDQAERQRRGQTSGGRDE